MTQSLTPISSNYAIRAYLNDHPLENIKWQEVINGDVKFSFKEIESFTMWELSLLVYAITEKNKNKQYMYSAMLGGE